MRAITSNNNLSAVCRADHFGGKNMNPLITLREIREAKPCASGWRQLLASLGTNDLDTRVSLGDIARVNSAEDALWCIRFLDWKDLALRRHVVKHVLLPTARRAEKYATDCNAAVARWCNDAVERWCDGEAVDLEAAEAAAKAADEMAAWAARAAASAKARGAVRAAKASSSADDEAAWAEAWAEAWEAERALQRADIIRAFPLHFLLNKENDDDGS